MKIYKKDNAMDALWELVSPLYGVIPIYKEVADEGEENLPESYLLIRADISDSGKLYGDGAAVFRESDCDILLVSKCTGARTDDIHNINIKRVKDLLDGADVGYTARNLGFDDTLKEAQYAWDVRIIYG